MANIIITNNGHGELVEIPANEELGTPYQAAAPADPDVVITAVGFEKVLRPGECVGLPQDKVYTIAVQE